MIEVKELGDGPALVLVPTLNGPWQYLGPAVDALARRFRVLTFSLGAGAENGRSGVADDAGRIAHVLDAVHLI